MNESNLANNIYKKFAQHICDIEAFFSTIIKLQLSQFNIEDMLSKMIDTAKQIKKDRKHVGNATLEKPYDVYTRKYGKPKISLKIFEKLYNSLEMVRLPRSYIDRKYQKITQVINLLLELNLKKMDLIGLFDSLIKKDIDIHFTAYNVIKNYPELDIRMVEDTITQARKIFFKDANVFDLKAIYGLLQIEASFLGGNDIICNSIVFNQLCRKLCEEKEILLLFPNVIFVHNLLSEIDFQNVGNITVVLENPILTKWFSIRFNKVDNISFINITDLEILKSINVSYDLIMHLNLKNNQFNRRINHELKLDSLKDMGYLWIVDVDYSSQEIIRYLDEINIKIEAIDLYPAGIKYAFSNCMRSMLIKARKMTQPNSILVRNFSKIELNGDYYLVKEPFEIKFSHKEILQSNSIRSLFRECKLEFLRKTDRTMKQSFECEYSNGLSFYYTYSYSKKKQVYNVDAYFCDINGKKILESVKRKDCKSIEDVDNWVKNVYPFAFINRKENTVDIRELVCQHVIENIAQYNISLKTLHYLCIHFDDMHPKKDIHLFNNFLESSVGELTTDSINEEVLNNELCNYTTDSLEQEILKYMVADLLEYAVKKNLVDNNPLNHVLDNFAFKRTRLVQDIRNNLARDYLMPEQLRYIYNLCMEKIEEGKKEYLAVLIELMVPIATVELSPLIWEDFQLLGYDRKNRAIYMFEIRCKVTFDGKVHKTLNNEFEHRYIPLPIELSEILLKHKEAVKKNTLLTDSELANTPILSGTTKPVDREYNIMSPDSISRLNKKTVRMLNISENMIQIQTENGTIVSDLNDFQGNVFITSFRHYTFSYFRKQEHLYLLGKMQEDTISKHYIDWWKKEILRNLHRKYKRYVAMLTNESENSVKYTKCISNHYHSNSKGLTKLDIRFLANDSFSMKVKSSENVQIDIKIVEVEMTC